MIDQPWARPWFAATAACAAAGIGIQLVLSWQHPAFFGGSPLGRALNVFAFFTIQSNVIVGVTALLFAIRMIFTAVRGPLASNWYPYPFADVHALGYVRVVINALWISLLFVALAAGANAVDRRLRQ